MADEAVAASLAELKRIAHAAKSRNDPKLRRATPEEVALALTQRKDWMCTGISSRTGLPCEGRRLLGATVCTRHGAALKHVKAAAEQRLREAAIPMLRRVRKLAEQSEHLPTAYNAARDLLDRAGIGALVESKVQAAQKDTTSRVIVNIGFLTTDSTRLALDAAVIDAPQE